MLEWGLQAALSDLGGKDSHPPATIPFFLRAQGPQMFVSAQIQPKPLSAHSQARAPGCACASNVELGGGWQDLGSGGAVGVFASAKPLLPPFPALGLRVLHWGGLVLAVSLVPPRMCPVPSVGHRYTGASGS